MCGILKTKITETSENILVWVVKKKYEHIIVSIQNDHQWEFNVKCNDHRFNKILLECKRGVNIEKGMFHSFKSVRKARILRDNLLENNMNVSFPAVMYPAVIPKGSYCGEVTVSASTHRWRYISGSHGYVSNELIMFETLEEAKEYIKNN